MESRNYKIDMNLGRLSDVLKKALESEHLPGHQVNHILAVITEELLPLATKEPLVEERQEVKLSRPESAASLQGKARGGLSRLFAREKKEPKEKKESKRKSADSPPLVEIIEEPILTPCTINIGVIGDVGVGKRTLIDRLKFNLVHKTQHIVEEKTTALLRENVTLQLYNRDFHSLPAERVKGFQFYKNIQAIFLVIDLSSAESFSPILQKWMSEVGSYAAPSCPILLIGNKSDSSSDAQLSEMKELADQYNVSCVEISARTGDRIDQLKAAIEKIIRGVQQQMKDAPKPSRTVKI